jgi:hypothetical protein
MKRPPTVWLRSPSLLLSTLASALLAGCAAPAAPTGPTSVVVDVSDYDALVDGTLTVLRQRDYEPSRVDRAAGVIVAGPTTGKQWFEFWRRDVVGKYEVLESSLHTVRRVVTVKITATAAQPVDDAEITPTSGAPAVASAPTTAAPTTAPATDGLIRPPLAGRYQLTIEVEKSRYSAPERQITTASGALMIYNEQIPTTEGLRGRASRDVHWVPLGRDGALEDYLLDAILKTNADVTVIH